MLQNLDPRSVQVLDRLFDSRIAQLLQTFGYRQDAMGFDSLALGSWLSALCAAVNAGGNLPTTSSSAATVPVSDSSTPVLAASSSRLGWSIRNSGSEYVYLTRGVTATTDAPILLAPGDRHDDATLWQGAISAICEAGRSSTLAVEELS